MENDERTSKLRNVLIDDDQSPMGEIPIPSEMLEQSLEQLEKRSIQNYDDIVNFREKVEDCRKELDVCIQRINEGEIYDDYAGIDGGSGNLSVSMSGSFSSAAGVWYPIKKKNTPGSKVTPIFLPPGISAPPQNYIFLVRQQFEYNAAIEASKKCNLVLVDGTIVPSIYARFLKAAQDFDKITPKFNDVFSRCFVDIGNGCLLKTLMKNDVPIVGIPKRVGSQHIIKTRMGVVGKYIPENFTDLMVCSIILKENEYMILTPYKDLIKERPRGMGYWNVLTKEMEDHTITAGGVNYISEAVKNTYVTYFKPYEGFPALRVEIFIKDKENIEKILRTIKKDYDKTVKLPFTIFMADRLSKSSSYIPAFFDSLIKKKVLEKISENNNNDKDMVWFAKTINDSYVFDE